MNVLLVGEYSGVHNALQQGLRHLGVNAVIASHGDGWKAFPTDISFGVTRNRWLNIPFRIVLPFWHVGKMRGYDVVQFINAYSFYPLTMGNAWLTKRVLNENNAGFMLACGDDPFYFATAQAKLRYSPVDDFLRYDCKSRWKREFWFRADVREWCKAMHDRVRAVIPLAYEYRLAYDWSPKRTVTIPFPVDTKHLRPQQNGLRRGRLVVFHGLNKPGFKGSRYILEAFRLLEEKHPKRFQFIVKEPLPFAKYLELLNQVNVVVDQTSSYSPGMNALISLALGKVVLSGGEPEAKSEWKAPHMPVINIRPDVNSIVDALIAVLDQAAEIDELSARGRAYVEDVHDCVKVAKQYVAVWREHGSEPRLSS